MTSTTPESPLSSLVGRGVVGGLLMGLANLVPGISGGTMLLAAGVYPEFISGVAEVTRLRFRVRSLVLLGAVVAAALVSILLFAGVAKGLVVDHRWAMYSLFIGLTLGGLPVVRSLIAEMTPRVWGGAVAGFIGMAALAIVQAMGSDGGSASGGAFMMLVAGMAGASAMILPGVSGGYLLLVLGAYVPILSGIDAFKEGLKAMDVAALSDPLFTVVLPVGVGVVIGIAGVSNLLGWCLDRHAEATYGVLLGLLLGAVVGLWPFQAGVAPQVGDTIKGKVLTEELLAEVDAEDWPTAYFTPSAGQVGGALGLVGIGFGITLGVAVLGRRREQE